jgi:rfaE bifunctional protein kinase chain/domain
LIVDSRYSLKIYTGATSATPNRDEVEQILGSNFTSEDCSLLRRDLGLAALLVTNGNQGISLFEGDNDPIHLDAVGSLEPVDVTGAGDTVIAAYTLGLAAGMSFSDAADSANHAGGVVVMKKRTASVTAAELIASIAGDSA